MPKFRNRVMQDLAYKIDSEWCGCSICQFRQALLAMPNKATAFTDLGKCLGFKRPYKALRRGLTFTGAIPNKRVENALQALTGPHAATMARVLLARLQTPLSKTKAKACKAP